MTPEARDDRLLGVLCLTARTSISRLPTTDARRAAGRARMRASQMTRSGRPWCGPLTVDAFSPALRGPRGMEDRAC